MGLKKKLGMGIMSAALGLSLVGGGTVAYFSSTQVTNNTFAAGTLDLLVNPTTIISVDNIKPGDKMDRGFQLINNGSLKIKDINLLTSYKVLDKDGKEVVGATGDADFAKHIKVNFLWNLDKNTTPIWETTLADLKDMDPNVVQKNFFDPLTEKKGIAPHSDDTFFVEFEFVDNNQDQNMFQGNKLELTWTFNATQTKGKDK
ncbi:TasA family protein [Microbacteriaceae bacterium 4G12]